MSPKRIGLGILLLFGVLVSATRAWSDPVELGAEVLEGSQALTIPGLGAAAVRYAIIHHARQEDRERLSQWLQAHEAASVRFSGGDGAFRRALLQRLKHCFGRGLLLYGDPVSLREKEIIRLELPDEQTLGR
ncbi:hypothetical protein [Nitrospira sp. Kam-Ns4a]